LPSLGIAVLSFVLSDVLTGSFTLTVAISVATVKRSIAEISCSRAASFNGFPA